MPLARYPDFRPLALEDAEDFDAVFERDPPETSELTFANLFAWKDAYAFEASSLDQCVIIRSALRGKTRFLPPAGAGDKKAALARVMEDARGECIRVPEALAAACAADSVFIVRADRDNADYLYKVNDLISLEGRRYDGKRNLIRKFKSAHAWEYARLDHSAARECLFFQDVWCRIKDCDSQESLQNERGAIRAMIEQCGALKLSGGGIRVDGQISAIAIAGRLNPDTMVMHALKADPDVPGLYQAMLNEFLRDHAGGYAFVNLEQDLGIEGLRASKLSYHPCRMIAKYIVAAAPA